MSVVSRDIALLSPEAVGGRSCSIREIARRRRVVLLILALVLMSAADLLCTLAYLTSVGMVEANPIAREMIAIGGTRQLILYKAFTITLSCGCIYFIRNTRRAEVGAWVCVALLFSLMVHWLQYNEVMQTLAPHFSSITLPGNATGYGDWIMIHD